MEKIRKNDEVVVIAGRDKGGRGIVMGFEGCDRVLVQGVNRVKKHVKPNPMRGQVGGVVEKEMPLHVSNVALFNPASQKADRVSVRILEDKNRVRVFKSSGELVGA